MLIHDYVDDGNVAGVADELARNVDIEVRDNRHDRTPLMYAVTSAKAGLDMVQFLLARGANPNAVVEASKYRAQKNVLCLAVGAGNRDKIALLLDAGADIRYKRPGPIRCSFRCNVQAKYRQRSRISANHPAIDRSWCKTEYRQRQVRRICTECCLPHWPVRCRACAVGCGLRP